MAHFFVGQPSSVARPGAFAASSLRSFMASYRVVKDRAPARRSRSRRRSRKRPRKREASAERHRQRSIDAGLFESSAFDGFKDYEEYKENLDAVEKLTGVVDQPWSDGS